MKVLGLKAIDQHISPLSLTFHWTRVFSSHFLSKSASQDHFVYLFIFTLSLPTNLRTPQTHSYVYCTSTKNLYRISKCLPFRNLPKDHDQCVVFWLISARQSRVQRICVLSARLHSMLWESQHGMLKDMRFDVRLLQIIRYPCLLVLNWVEMGDVFLIW